MVEVIEENRSFLYIRWSAISIFSLAWYWLRVQRPLTLCRHGLNYLGFGVLLKAKSREAISRTHPATENLHGTTVAIRQMLAVCMHTLGLLIASQLGRLPQCSLDFGSGDAKCVLGFCYERSSSNRGKIPRWCWKNTLPVFGSELLSVRSSEGVTLLHSFAMW